MKRIVIVGAGSVVFSSRLTADICTFAAISDAHFALVDIDEKKLEYAGRIAQRVFKEGRYDKASFSLHLDRRDALADADIVITSILVGGYDPIKSEIDIPLKYGIDQCIGDTLTPGGIMRCLRTLPVQIEIARDVVDICPNAWMLNYTNPMSMLTWGMLKAVPKLKLVGLCHSVQGTLGEWATRLKIPVSEISFDCAGINHEAWFTRFEHKGKDLLPEIRKLALRQDIWNGDSTRMEIVKHFGFPVTESSGHVSEYNPWFRKNNELIQRYCHCDDKNKWNGDTGFIKELYCRENWEIEMESIADGSAPLDIKRSLEYGSKIVNALAGAGDVFINGNVLNSGYIENLPENSCVEVKCLVDKNGIHPQKQNPLPTHLAAINRTQINVQELAVEAALTAEPELVFQAMAMDPLTGMCCTLDQIRSMTRELMNAHEKWIPQFGRRLPAKKQEFTFLEEVEAERHIDPAENH